MSVLDAFFGIAVPIVVVTVVVGSVARRYDRSHGIYRGAEGAARRDEVNRTWRTNRGAAVIGVVFVGVWVLLVAALIQEWGMAALTVLVALFLILPVFTVAVCVIALYTFVVHALASRRGG